MKCIIYTMLTYNSLLRASSINHAVHHRCHCRRRSLQRRLARHQLANGILDLSWLVHYRTHCWPDIWCHDGFHRECAPLVNNAAAGKVLKQGDV